MKKRKIKNPDFKAEKGKRNNRKVAIQFMSSGQQEYKYRNLSYAAHQLRTSEDVLSAGMNKEHISIPDVGTIQIRWADERGIQQKQVVNDKARQAFFERNPHLRSPQI